MNKLVATALTMSSLCCFSINAQAASLGLTLTSYVSDSSTPAPRVPGLFLYKNTDKIEGQITFVDGFSSLQGVSPGQLTIDGGGWELLSFENQNGIIYSTSGATENSAPYFNILKDGQVIASSIDVKGSGSLNAIAGSPDYGQASSVLSITFSGIAGEPFYQEILQLTGNTGKLNLEIGTPTGIKSSFKVGTVGDTNTFTFTGNTLSIAPSPTTVPEPPAVLGLAVVSLISGIGGVSKARKSAS